MDSWTAEQASPLPVHGQKVQRRKKQEKRFSEAEIFLLTGRSLSWIGRYGRAPRGRGKNVAAQVPEEQGVAEWLEQ